MYGAIVVLWLGSEPELAERRTDLAAWAAERQRRPEPLVAAGPAYPAELAEQVEALLEEARAAPAALDAASALQRAEAVLLEHPELPQAPWLLAERYAIEAHGAALGGPEAAQHGELLERARRLEGARAAPVGSPPLPEPPAAEGRVPQPSGARAHDRVFIDGAVAARGALAPGRHHVLWMRGGLRVWAGWVALEPSRPWPLSDPTTPCSALDLADVDAGADAPRPPSGVLCQRWAIARPRPSGGIDIAECAATRCGRWQRASRESDAQGLAGAPPVRAEDAGAWPGWATWTLVGAGAAAAAGVVLWRVGAFDRTEPGTEFVFTGPSAPAYRF